MTERREAELWPVRLHLPILDGMRLADVEQHLEAVHRLQLSDHSTAPVRG